MRTHRSCLIWVYTVRQSDFKRKKQRSKVATIKESVKSPLKFEPHSQGCHCVVSLSKTFCPLLSAGSTQEDTKSS